MRRFSFTALFLLLCPIAAAEHPHHLKAALDPDAAKRVSPCRSEFAAGREQPDIDKVNWNITSNSPTAKLFFRQGMTEYYGFNYEEALRNFRKATNWDGWTAMAYWGIAMAAGPNINIGQEAPCYKVAKDASERADYLAWQQEKTLPAVERDLIAALHQRYLDPLHAAKAYNDGMAKAWETAKQSGNRENIANVGALYAESLMELAPWDWYVNKVPKEDTKRILAVLRDAMNVEPDAVGANHFWIHAVEEGATPGDARRSANLLNTLVPAAGHLMHMPSHIFLLLGNYYAAVDSNEKAAEADRLEYGEACKGFNPLDSKSATLCPALYYGHYRSHNLFFGAVSATFSGQSRKALELAVGTREHAQRFVANEPGLQRYMTAPLMTMVMNRDWDTILDEKLNPEPPPACYSEPFTPTGCQHPPFHLALGQGHGVRHPHGEAQGGPRSGAQPIPVDEGPEGGDVRRSVC
jgi:hypothetical protein